jgi:hypothetical protein
MVSDANLGVMKAVVTGSDCLIVSCSDLVPIFEQIDMNFEEAFLEESAINSLQRSIKKFISGECFSYYKFVLVNLDDPTLLLGRFVANLDKLLSQYP